jgi:hypothetical protein
MTSGKLLALIGCFLAALLLGHPFSSEAKAEDPKPLTRQK